MPRLTRRQLRRITVCYEIRNKLRLVQDAWPRGDDWLAFVAVAIPILTAAVVVAVIVERMP